MKNFFVRTLHRTTLWIILNSISKFCSVFPIFQQTHGCRKRNTLQHQTKPSWEKSESELNLKISQYVSAMLECNSLFFSSSFPFKMGIDLFVCFLTHIFLWIWLFPSSSFKNKMSLEWSNINSKQDLEYIYLVNIQMFHWISF